jgi:hypothetical protein
VRVPLSIVPGGVATVAILIATGCWKLEYSELGQGAVAFDPVAGAPEGWMVSFHKLPLECPDGEQTQVYVVHPEASDGPIPYAVVYHSGALDWVFAASLGNPLAGPSYQPESHLGSEWAFRQVFTTLGMYPAEDPVEPSTGALVAALAEAGVASVLPANCWGDLWHDYPGLVDNDYTKDGFSRQGRTAAEFAWRLVAEYEEFSPIVNVTLSVPPDPEHVYAFGIGEGGRAVGELYHHGYAPRSFAVDSPLDDVSFYWDQLAPNDELLLGLDRIFPGGPEGSLVGSLATAPYLPERMALIVGTADPRLPDDAVAPLIARLEAEDDAWINEVDAQGHTHINADIVLARAVVSYVLEAPAWDAPEIEEPEELSPYAWCTAVAERDDGLDGAIEAIDVSTYDGSGVIDRLARDFDNDGRDDELSEYNDAGLLAKLRVDEDDDGTFDADNGYSYDDRGRLLTWTYDAGANGSINASCSYAWTDDAVQRPIQLVESCDDHGDGVVDRIDTTEIVYGWSPPSDTGDTGDTAAKPAGPGDPPDTVVAHLVDRGTDGSVDELLVYTYPWDDGEYARPTSLEVDLGVDGVIEERSEWAYNNLDQLTFEGHDSDGNGSLDFVALYGWDKEDHLITEQIDPDGDATFDILWTYSYDGYWRPLLATGDELVDGSPNVLIETAWTCEPPDTTDITDTGAE